MGLLVAGRSTPYGLLVAPLMAAGFGMSFTTPAATTAVTEAAPASRVGLASGVVNAARQVGSVVGVALLGAMVGGGAFVPRLRLAMLVAGSVFLLAAVLTAVAVERPARHVGGAPPT